MYRFLLRISHTKFNILTECADREINSPDGKTEQGRSLPETMLEFLNKTQIPDLTGVSMTLPLR